MKKLKPYFRFSLFVLAILFVPMGVAQKVRHAAIGVVAPFRLVRHEKEMEKELAHLQEIVHLDGDPFYERRVKYLANYLQRATSAVPARVIFRDPGSWSSHIWIDSGENQGIEKDAPVVIGKAVVGVVQEVEKKRSLVRLVTDASLHISVRTTRGGEQNRRLSSELVELIELLSVRDDLYKAVDLAHALTAFRESLPLDEKDLYLAKGEVHGASRPLWRSLGQTLKGEGFNYDYSDIEGPARDLRTGEGVPLICTGDLLVTTGMDGIFPPDLHVGVVTKIFPLNEGGCSYKLEAKACAPDLNSLTEVIVLTKSSS